MTHWPPREGDWVHDQSREDKEEWPHGQIIGIDRDWSDQGMSEVLIHFKKHETIQQQRGVNILSYDTRIDWSFVGAPKGFVRLAGELVKCDYKLFKYIWTGEEYSFGGCNDLVTMYFDDFEGNWSSRDGGNGRWEI